MIPVFIRADAELDIRLAASWYETEESGLGDRFADELAIVLKRISERPNQFSRVAPRIHRALLHRFPHAVYFVPEPERLVVIGVLHQRRDPTAWRDRAAGSKGAG